MTDGAEIIERLREQFSEDVVSTGADRGQHWAEIQPGRLIDVCRWLRDDPQADFDFLVDVTAVHWPDDPRPIEAVYHLASYSRNDRLRLKVRVADGEKIPSLAGLWRSANWNEREAYDMFGVEFLDHPDLRRILMPDDYTDFPLRKELPLFRA